jgi:hypothetical protein
MSETKKFVELVAANPDLPIVARVNGEICEPDATLYWMGSFSAVSVELIGLIDERWYDDVDDFKEVYYDKYSEELCEKFNYDPRCCAINVDRGLYTQDQFAANCLAEEELEKYLSEMVKKYMRRCIVVYIDEPDMRQWEEA